MTEWLNVILQGVLIGGLYAMFAAGLSLIFGVMRLVNIAHGDLIVLAAYVALMVTQTLGLDPLTSLILVVPIMAVIGYALSSLPILFVALFGFGTLAALFGPIKFGILPDHLKREELSAGNALVEGATFIAILLGTIAGGLASRGGGETWIFAALVVGFALACPNHYRLMFMTPKPLGMCAADSRIARVVEVSRLRLLLNVPETAVGLVREGQSVEFATAAFPGTDPIPPAPPGRAGPVHPPRRDRRRRNGNCLSGARYRIGTRCRNQGAEA